MKNPKIGIVGSSIAGSSAGIILHRLGFPVEIFEQYAKESLKSKGAGLALPKELISRLIKEELLDPDFPSTPITQRVNCALDRTDNARHMVTHSVDVAGVNWQHLREGLIRQLPENLVSYQSKVTNVVHGSKITLTINGKESKDFDIVIFADGHRSLGRRTFFPHLNPNFAQSILWRGLLKDPPEEMIQDLQHRILNVFSKNSLAFFYLIPDLDPRKCLLNWGIYEKVDSTHCLFQKDVSQAKKNSAAGKMPSEYIDYFHTRLIQHVPKPLRKVVLETKHPFIQTIQDLLPPTYVQDNMVLIGDASTLLLPVTASGAAKALQDVLALGKAIKETQDVHKALNQWNQNQIQANDQLFQLGRKLIDFFLIKAPDWEKTTQAIFDHQWHAIVDKVNWTMSRPS